jgi:hypothetical protein
MRSLRQLVATRGKGFVLISPLCGAGDFAADWQQL